MRLRTLSTSVVLAVVATVPLAGAAFAQEDRDCPDFPAQASAQAALRAGDPERLDADDDGVACENYAYAGSASPASAPQVAATPVGGVEAGGGPVDLLPLALGAVVAGGVGAVAVRRVAPRRG